MTDLSPRLAALSPEQRAQLARLLRERAQREQAATIPRRSPHTDTAPCSWMQRGLWLLDQLQPNAAYNLAILTRLRGRLDVALLEQVLNEVIRRHEVLRTTFQAEDGEPVQRIAPELYVPIAVVDVSAVPAEERDAEAQRRATQEAQRLFDLAHGPLLRPTLLQFTDSDWRIIFVVHHIISDAWGMGLLVSEVQALCAAFQDGLPSPLPELPIQYADYAAWQRTTYGQEAVDRDLAYWKQQLADAPSTELLTDTSRPSVRRFRGSRVRLQFPTTVVERLAALSRREGATIYMVLLAAFQTLLHRYTGQDDIVVGSPMVDRRHAETHGLIGFFLNTLVMRADLSGDPTFREFLQRVRRVALEAYEHQNAPFDQIVKILQPARDPSRSPLFQIMFTFHDAMIESADLAGLELESDDVDSGTTQFDLSLMLEQAGNSVTGTVEFDTDLFERATIERLVEHWGVLLDGIAADPERRLSELPLLSEVE
ncbi:MAG: hypothetical protein IT305_28465, partial [Chloroflexi bacterium]|nr:hypothetical protein [Chloroflexota bacterium]